MDSQDLRPLIFVDVTAILKSWRHPLFWNVAPPVPDIEAERAFVAASKYVRVSFLCPFSFKRVAWLETQNIIVPLAYHSLVPCECRGMFDLLRDSFTPYNIYSNEHLKWNYSDVIGFKTWHDVLDHVRHEIVGPTGETN